MRRWSSVNWSEQVSLGWFCWRVAGRTYAREGFGVTDEEIVEVRVYCQCLGTGFLQERVLAVVFYCALDSREGSLGFAALAVVNVLV
jgi:hypothetical protein